jgi:hypothetical protein
MGSLPTSTFYRGILVNSASIVPSVRASNLKTKRHKTLFNSIKIFIKMLIFMLKREHKEDIPILINHFLERIALVNKKSRERISPVAGIIENECSLFLH